MRRVFIMLVLVAGFLQLANSQDNTHQVYSAGQLKADYQLAVSALREAHPGLYRYITKADWDKLAGRLEKQLDQPMDQAAFYKTVFPLITAIRCGHTKFYPAGSDTDKYPYKKTGLLPIKLFFREQKAYLWYAYTNNPGIQSGTEILSINGQSIASLLSQLSAFIPADGTTRTSLNAELNQFFNAYYSTFIDASSRFTITHRSNGKTKSLSVDGVSLETILAKDRSMENPGQSFMELTIPASTTAVLTVRSFYPDGGIDEFTKMTDSMFQAIRQKGVTNLVVDLRDNEGGIEEAGGYLCRNLLTKPFTYYKKVNVATNKEFSFRAHAWLPPQYDEARALIVEKDGEYLWPLQQYLAEQSPAENVFRGNIYVLLNGRSFSVTSELAAVLKQDKRIRMLGEETGGAYNADNSGVFTVLTLPNTKMVVGIPLMAYHMNIPANKQTGGVHPDTEVKPGIKDLLDSRDPVMETTMRLIKQQHAGSSGHAAD